MVRHVLLGLLATTLAGCYSMQGSERVLDRNGYITTPVVPKNSIFALDFERAFQKRQSGEDDDTLTQRMLSSGFTHIYAFCDNYFDRMGLQQRRSRVTRDALAPISALITGVIALHSFENNTGTKEDLLAALGLATAGTASILDIYDQHMLFGAENIGAVETLTMEALSAHGTAVQELQNMTFEAATRHLIDNQAICSPQHILALTREAINEGRVAARQKPSTTDNVGNLTDEAVGDANKKVDISIENDAPPE